MNGTTSPTIIIIIIRFYRLSKQLAVIAQLVAVHEFVQSGQPSPQKLHHLRKPKLRDNLTCKPNICTGMLCSHK